MQKWEVCNGSRSICTFQLVRVQRSAVSKSFLMCLTAILVVSQSIATGNILLYVCFYLKQGESA